MIEEVMIWRVEGKEYMVEMIVLRKKNLIWHIMRGDGLIKEVMEGEMEGKRGPGRKHMIEKASLMIC